MQFDHCYQKLDASEPYFALAERGFSLSSDMTEHPGRQLCRFIRFNRSALSTLSRPQYLEFVELADFEALRSTYPKDTTEDVLREPGFSLAADKRLEEVYRFNFAAFEKFQPTYSHKNYAWKHDDKSELPGWNFLEFAKPIVNGMNVWCTEYEPNPNRQVAQKVEPHANTANQIRGFIWNVSPHEAAAFAQLSDSQVVDNKMNLADGSTIFLDQNFGGANKKQTSFSAVILGCSDWDMFCREAKPDKIIDWQNQKAAVIEFGPTGWDIVVVPN
jgi:hypothetical protein